MILLFAMAVACQSPDEKPSSIPSLISDQRMIYQELHDQGLGRYLDQFVPNESTTDEFGITAHRFSAESDGPRCMLGSDYYAMTRDQEHENLVIFLQGGGLCYSELCIAVSAGSSLFPNIDILQNQEENPVGDWNQVYIPYCDGSLFAGDVDVDENEDGIIDRSQRGLMNLSASIDLAAQNFPSPNRIFLGGSSGGGYGTIAATVLVRWKWPDASIYVFNDAGVGLGMDQEPQFIQDIIDEFNAKAFIPASQHALLEGGHLTPLIGWQLDQDPNLKISAFSYRWDYVISQIYLAVDDELFDQWLQKETAALHEKHPNRYNYFLPNGSAHTALLGDPSGFLDTDSSYFELLEDLLGDMDDASIGDTTLRAWLRDFMEDNESWRSIKDE